MARKRKDAGKGVIQSGVTEHTSDVIGEAAEPGPIAPPVVAPPASQQSKQRISLPLAEDGRSIDFEAMRSDARERARAIISQSEVGSPAGQPQVFQESHCKAVYMALGELEIFLAQKAMPGLPDHVARDIFAYSDEEVKALSEPTADVVNKWCGPVFEKFGPEITLGLYLASIHQRKLVAVKLWALAESERRKMAEATRHTNGKDKGPEMQPIA